MQPNEIEAVLIQMAETLASLCEQTADLVDDYSTRVVRGKPADVRLRADQLRVRARSLQQALHKVRAGSDS